MDTIKHNRKVAHFYAYLTEKIEATSSKEELIELLQNIEDDYYQYDNHMGNYLMMFFCRDLNLYSD